MSVYLEEFTLPDTEKEEELIACKYLENGKYIDDTYPCGILSVKRLECLTFKDITILYGGNGSGKSTLLNTIACKLELKRNAPFNGSELFDRYAKSCSYKMGIDDYGKRLSLPQDSRIICSDDIFDYMLTVRDKNDGIEQAMPDAKQEWMERKFSATVHLRSMDDYEDLKKQVMARTKTRRQYIINTLGHKTRLISNGETALEYFNTVLKNDCLYCLDEPENSMSPKMQLLLLQQLEQQARYCSCQFIISTHSPFLLSMENALVYNLDETPVSICNWWELENTRIYYDFFKKNAHLFE